MTKDELTEAIAQKLHSLGQGLKALEQPWDALSESRREYYLIQARVLVDSVIAGRVLDWLAEREGDYPNACGHLAKEWYDTFCG